MTLVDPARKPGDAEGGEGSGSRSSGSSIPADPMGEELFEELRVLRRKLADDRNVPPYVVFSDATLREMAAVRPGSTESLLNVRGVGQRKAAEFGDEFLGVIAFFCLKRSLKHDAPRPEGDPGTARPARRASASDIAAGALFAQGASVERVMAELGRAHSTVTGYLRRYIQEHKPDTIDPWVDRATADVIVETARKLGTGSWMPIRDALGERAPVDAIFFVLDHLRSRGIDPTAGRPFPGDSPPTPPTPEPEQ